MEYSVWLENRAIELRSNPTTSEKSLKGYLKKLHVKYNFQVPIMCGEKGYIADFLFPNNIILEVDGETHSSVEAKAYDRERTRLLEELGYKVIRIMNSSTVKERMERIIPAILKKHNIKFTPIKRKSTSKKSKTKNGEQKKKWVDYKYDPDFKSKLYAVNGW
jgi:very-short-patch-repair endonuclease